MSAAAELELNGVDVLHAAERIRDCPASCSCLWHWSGDRYTRIWPDPACAWHSPGGSR